MLLEERGTITVAELDFQFLLGCYLVNWSIYTEKYGLSIPFRMLRAEERLLVGAYIINFQFLLGCYRIILPPFTVGLAYLSIPFRMLPILAGRSR